MEVIVRGKFRAFNVCISPEERYKIDEVLRLGWCHTQVRWKERNSEENRS